MRKTTRIVLAGGAATALLAALSGANATTYTIDFTTMTPGTPVASGPDVALSMYGAPVSSGAPTIVGIPGFGNVWLSNTPDGATSSSGIDFAFSTPVNNVSFTFVNNGVNGTSNWSANNGQTGAIGDATYCCNLTPVTVTGGSLTDLKIDNGQNGAPYQFGVGQITYSTVASAVPEPATWAMMGLGFAGLAFAGFRARKGAMSVAA